MKTKKMEERRKETFVCMVIWCGVAIKFLLQRKSSLFHLLLVADMGGFRKIFNVLEIGSNDMLRLYFHYYRKDLKSMVFVEV